MQNVDLFRHKLAFIINSNHALFFAGIDNGRKRRLSTVWQILIFLRG
ncbi:Uncharacterised protein [Klebsiella pneumoniae]|nr:Uncharacterised protein [Klebsiella pneumoniae]